jgi:aspartyl-tRNA(Asn)/glutamyl-tRNA(Gln) amidotransferase subunit C
LDIKTTQKVADLAMLSLSQSEIEQIALDLSIALKQFSELSQVETASIEPLISPIEITTILRDDQEVISWTTEECLANAPDRVGALFKVPPTV